MPRRAIAEAVVVLTLLLAGAPSAATAQPATAAPPGPELGDVLDAVAMMNRVPIGIRETCRPTDTFLDGMTTAVECEVEGGLVFYSRFTDAATASAAYDALVASSGLTPGSGPGCGSGASESAYDDADGTADGRLLCHLTNGAYISVWTDAHEPILAGILLGTDAGFPTLAAIWERARLLPMDGSAGPVASGAPEAGASPAASAAPSPMVTAAPSGSANPDSSEPPMPSPATASGETLVQWASSATASSEYGADAWSAAQATGEPDTPEYGDYETAWAPSGSDIGPQWIALGYDIVVTPTEIVIWESSGAGFVTLVEALDARTGDWVTLWQGTDGSPDFLVGFSPPLEAVDVLTDRLRITIDTDVPGWNEIDAVALIGVPASPA
jgi:hypothetical protein